MCLPRWQAGWGWGMMGALVMGTDTGGIDTEILYA